MKKKVKKEKKEKVTTNKNKNKNQINININSHNKRRRAPTPRQPNNTSIIVNTPNLPYIPQDNGLNHIYPILQNIHEKVHQQSQPMNKSNEVYEIQDMISNIDNTIQNIENTKTKMKEKIKSAFKTPGGYISETDSEAGYNPLGFVSPRANKPYFPPSNLSPYKESADFVDDLGSTVVVKKKPSRTQPKRKAKDNHKLGLGEYRI